MEKSPVEVFVHQPERRRSSTVTLPCGCCCCCCCCLHTIGGIVGAIIASNVAARQEMQRAPLYDPYADEVPDLSYRHPSNAIAPQAIYWYLFLGLTGLALFLTCAGVGSESGGAGPFIALVLLLIFLPAVQLVAAVLAIPLVVLTDRANAAPRIWAIAKITLGLIIGTGVGLGGVVLLFAICTGGFR